MGIGDAVVVAIGNDPVGVSCVEDKRLPDRETEVVVEGVEERAPLGIGGRAGGRVPGRNNLLGVGGVVEVHVAFGVDALGDLVRSELDDLGLGAAVVRGKDGFRDVRPGGGGIAEERLDRSATEVLWIRGRSQRSTRVGKRSCNSTCPRGAHVLRASVRVVDEEGNGEALPGDVALGVHHLVLAEAVAVVAEEDHDGVVPERVVVEKVENAADVVVHLGHGREVGLEEVPPARLGDEGKVRAAVLGSPGGPVAQRVGIEDEGGGIVLVVDRLRDAPGVVGVVEADDHEEGRGVGRGEVVGEIGEGGGGRDPVHEVLGREVVDPEMGRAADTAREDGIGMDELGGVRIGAPGSEAGIGRLHVPVAGLVVVFGLAVTGGPVAVVPEVLGQAHAVREDDVGIRVDGPGALVAMEPGIEAEKEGGARGGAEGELAGSVFE